MNPFGAQIDNSQLIIGLVRDRIPVTPNDTEDNVGAGNVAIGLDISGAGVVVYITVDGNTRTETVAANTRIICSVSRVLATGTTATGIIAVVM